MDDDQWLEEQIRAHRGRLHAIALRMLGSPADADDAVAETWIRLRSADPDSIESIGGWLTTVVSRVALDQIRSRKRRDVVAVHDVHEPVASELGPAGEAELADAVSAALLVVLEQLSPGERLAFVLHDAFKVPYDEIAAILGRSPAATKQLAHRARSKVTGAGDAAAAASEEHRLLVERFLGAARDGDLAGLVAMLAPDATMAADDAAVQMGSVRTTTGAAAVAETFSGRALGARAAAIDGAVGFAWSVGGGVKVAWDVVVVDGRIAHIDMLADQETLARTPIAELA